MVHNGVFFNNFDEAQAITDRSWVITCSILVTMIVVTIVTFFLTDQLWGIFLLLTLFIMSAFSELQDMFYDLYHNKMIELKIRCIENNPPKFKVSDNIKITGWPYKEGKIFEINYRSNLYGYNYSYGIEYDSTLFSRIYIYEEGLEYAYKKVPNCKIFQKLYPDNEVSECGRFILVRK